MIYFNGYYRSNLPKESTDSYGGNVVNELIFTYLIFQKKGSVLRYLSKDPIIFQSDVKNIIKGSKSTYLVKGDRIELDYLPDLEFVDPFYYKILSPELIVTDEEEDKFDTKYHFHPWPDPKQ